MAHRLGRNIVLLTLLLVGCSAPATPPPLPAPQASEDKTEPPRPEPLLKDKTIAEWVRVLKNDRGRRRDAATTLVGVEAESVSALVPMLVEALKHDEAEVRQLSAYVLGNIDADGEAVLRGLVGALSDADDGVRRAAATALVQVGRGLAGEVTPLLKAPLTDSNDDVRRLAAYVLQNVDPETHKAYENLLAKLQQEAEEAKRARERVTPVEQERPKPTKTRVVVKKHVNPKPLLLGVDETDDPDEPPTPGTSAEAFHNEAIYLHIKRRFSEAADKMRRALSLPGAPSSYHDYLAELENLAHTEAVDRHALKAPESAEQTMMGLVSYLTATARNDHDKARAIFRWIADRITYDVEGFITKKRGDNSAEGAFKNRLCVCEGYARLFVEMCKMAGLEAELIIGDCKGAGLSDGERGKHAWNAVKINERWHVLDVTFASGGINVDKRAFQKFFKDYYFLTPPERFIFSHLPMESRWQLLESPVAKAEWEDWPKVEARLLQRGIPTDRLRTQLAHKRGLVQAYDYFGPKVVIQEAPLDKQLSGSHLFRIEAAGISDMVVINGTQWHHLKKNGNIFEGQITVQPGEVRIGARAPTLYAMLLKYSVE